MHIPPGFNTVAPYIFVNDASACVDFLVNGLGGTEILRHLDGSRIANAQVRIGASTIMVSDASQGGVRDPSGNIWWLSQRLAPGGY